MKLRSSRIVVAGIAVSLTFGSVLPAGAAPLFAPFEAAPPPHVVKVQSGGGDMGGSRPDPQLRRGQRPPHQADRPRVDRPQVRQDRRSARPDRFERRGNDAYYNGHRGYRDRRDGYREHNGFWFPAAAFLAGALLGGAVISNQNQAVAAPPPGSNPHVDWCMSQYRTYNPYDNSFQPYTGPRRACRSPYG
jgi:hypothetical protein